MVPSKRICWTFSPKENLVEKAKEVFMPGPKVTFLSSRKLSSYLVRANLYPLERVTGSCKCHGIRCAVCLNVNQTSPFISSVTHETCKTNHEFDFNSKFIIYFLTWKQCSKQYVGQTVDDFRLRWNNYKDNNIIGPWIYLFIIFIVITLRGMKAFLVNFLVGVRFLLADSFHSFSGEKPGGCTLCFELCLFIYLFVICLFIVCLCFCFLFTLRELFVGPCIKY